MGYPDASCERTLKRLYGRKALENVMRKRRSADQRIMDRARQARKERIQRSDPQNYTGPADGGIRETPGGGKGMIKVTRLSGEVLYLNVFQIESMESIPETKIKMMNGYYFLVKDSVYSVIDQIKSFMHSCVVFSGQE